jgi:type VI protein secretion system component VasK
MQRRRSIVDVLDCAWEYIETVLSGAKPLLTLLATALLATLNQFVGGKSPVPIPPILTWVLAAVTAVLVQFRAYYLVWKARRVSEEALEREKTAREAADDRLQELRDQMLGYQTATTLEANVNVDKPPDESPPSEIQ